MLLIVMEVNMPAVDRGGVGEDERLFFSCFHWYLLVLKMKMTAVGWLEQEPDRRGSRIPLPTNVC